MRNPFTVYLVEPKIMGLSEDHLQQMNEKELQTNTGTKPYLLTDINRLQIQYTTKLFMQKLNKEVYTE